MNNMTTQTIETDKQASRTMQKERVLNCDVPVYLYPSAYAQRHGEIEEYRVSRQANIACRDAIDQAIRTYYHDNMLNKKRLSPLSSNMDLTGQCMFWRLLCWIRNGTVVSRKATKTGRKCSRFLQTMMRWAMKDVVRL